MKVRKIIWLTVAAIGLLAGAMGTRFAASTRDIAHLSDIPFVELFLFIPIFLLISWAATSIVGKYTQPFVFGASVLGMYGTAYGLSELAFHSLNHQNAFSSLSLFLFGVVIIVSCYVSNALFGNRWRGA